MTTQDNLLNAEALLDTHYSEIPPLPKYCSFPTGTFKYRCIGAKIVPPADGKDLRIDISMEMLEATEVAEGATLPTPEVGSLMSVMFSGAKGIQRMSEVFKEVMVGLDITTPRELIEQLETVEIYGANKSRAYKDKVTQELRYGNDLSLVVMA